MLFKEFAVAASVFALTACAGAQADLADADHNDHYALGMDGNDYSFSASGLTHEELIELRREINEEVREELAEARLEIREALAETRRELEALEFTAHPDVDAEKLSETILMSVQTALQEARQGLEEAEKQLARDEVRLAREAEHLERQAARMARQAERMARKAAEMKARADAMKREGKEAPKAPKAPPHTKLIEPGNSAPVQLAASTGEPLHLYRQASPYIH